MAATTYSILTDTSFLTLFTLGAELIGFGMAGLGQRVLVSFRGNVPGDETHTIGFRWNPPR